MPLAVTVKNGTCVGPLAEPVPPAGISTVTEALIYPSLQGALVPQKVWHPEMLKALPVYEKVATCARADVVVRLHTTKQRTKTPRRAKFKKLENFITRFSSGLSLARLFCPQTFQFPVLTEGLLASLARDR
jgi:hypothetical protein